ncbi:uncharacterized protein [Spinacia oleracea]|uniref:Small ribosomal subunit protein mS23 n=1 Tax=Spinacia oleracea TaxID=3562 RepID=A0A9R0HWK2_SPIOL|nr:uncharacterized protein LOC110777885 [Spinacia oleracea]
MSYMKGDLLTKTRKLVKGLAKTEPLWLKPMLKAPPVVFPRSDGKVKPICLPEDVYVNKFYQKNPESKYEDPIKLTSFSPIPARVFAGRVLELKEHGVREEEAISIADMEYRGERKSKKQAHKRLRKIAHDLGKRPSPNPYPSAMKEIQAEERPHVRDRFFNPQILEIAMRLKEERAADMRERFGGR